jgi:hypothetical protein
MTTQFMSRSTTPARRNTVLQTHHLVDDVWAAAVLADQINQGYVRETQYSIDLNTGVQQVVKETNRTVMMTSLYNPHVITDQLRQAGRELRQQLSQELTLRMLRGTTNDFDRSIQQALAVTTQFSTMTHRMEMAVIPCLPDSLRRSQNRAQTDAVLRQCQPLAADVGAKVDLRVRVVRCFFSKNHGVDFVTTITPNNCAVMFSYKQAFEANTELDIRGTVRGHGADLTRLNRVKVI